MIAGGCYDRCCVFSGQVSQALAARKHRGDLTGRLILNSELDTGRGRAGLSGDPDEPFRRGCATMVGSATSSDP